MKIKELIEEATEALRAAIRGERRTATHYF
jgi:hypothetical protein